MTSYDLVERPTDDPTLVVVEVAGELDLTNAHEVEERLGALVVGESETLVLDLNRLLFIDSAALHVLFRLARRLGRDRFCLVLQHGAPIARTLSIVGITKVARVSETPDDHVAAVE